MIANEKDTIIAEIQALKTYIDGRFDRVEAKINTLKEKLDLTYKTIQYLPLL